MRNHVFILIAACFISNFTFSQSWQKITLHDLNGCGNGIFFGDTGIIFGGSGKIFHTNNFFDTYYIDSTYKGTGYLGGLSFPTREIGYSSNGYVSGGLLKTVDGGNTWQPMPFVTTSCVTWGNKLVFTSPDTGYGATSSNYICFTTNGGETCNGLSVNLDDIVWLSKFSVTRDSIIYALACSNTTLGYWRFVKSTDRGQNWQLLSFIPALSWTSDFHFTDDTTVIVAINDMSIPIILKSGNAGISFDTVLYADSHSSGYTVKGGNYISFINRDTGFVAFSNSIYKTYTAGNSWIRTSFQLDAGSYDKLYFLKAISAEKIIAGGRLDTIYITKTAGGVWADVTEVEPYIQLSLYPNPATHQLTITTSNFQPESFSIYNTSGQRLREMKYSPQVDVSALPPGIYFIELKAANGVARRKFVKQ